MFPLFTFVFHTHYCVTFCEKFLINIDKRKPKANNTRTTKNVDESGLTESESSNEKKDNNNKTQEDQENVSTKVNRIKFYRIVANEWHIHRQSIGDEENTRKRVLFDGYRALMRSVLMMIAILQIYVMLIGDKSSLAAYVTTISATPAYKFIRILLVIALVMRYWHYSCTKFTYCYNGYLHNCSTNSKT